MISVSLYCMCVCVCVCMCNLRTAASKLFRRQLQNYNDCVCHVGRATSGRNYWHVKVHTLESFVHGEMYVCVRARALVGLASVPHW